MITRDKPDAVFTVNPEWPVVVAFCLAVMLAWRLGWLGEPAALNMTYAAIIILWSMFGLRWAMALATKRRRG